MTTIQGIQQALDIIALMPIGAAVALFGYHMVMCWNRTGRKQQASQVAPMPEQGEAPTQQWAAMTIGAAEAVLTVEVEQKAPDSVSYDDMNITRLRKECKSLGVQWRIPDGKNSDGKTKYRYLKKEEILEAIAAI